MKTELYKKGNNLFQSDDWLKFQREFGRDAVDFNEYKGIKIELPFKKFFVWVQKGPQKPNLKEIGVRAKELGAVFVRVEPETIDEKDMAEFVLRKVTKHSLLAGQASPKATRVIDITKSEEELLAEMKPKTRYNIRLAEKKEVKVRATNDASVLYNLLLETAKRDKGYAPHSKEYYSKMIKELGVKEFASIFVAEKDGAFLAAILVSFYGDVATYLHGGFSEEYRNLMAPYLCQWEAIKYAKVRGCKYYDFWGVTESDDPKDPWAGISRFKEGFGGEKVIFPGSYDIVISKFWYNVLTLGAKLKHIARR